MTCQQLTVVPSTHAVSHWAKSAHGRVTAEHLWSSSHEDLLFFSPESSLSGSMQIVHSCAQSYLLSKWPYISILLLHLRPSSFHYRPSLPFPSSNILCRMLSFCSTLLKCSGLCASYGGQKNPSMSICSHSQLLFPFLLTHGSWLSFAQYNSVPNYKLIIFC